MAIYDLYGINASSIEEAKSLVERLLSIQLEERESSYHRGPYFAHGQIGHENFEIKFNMDPFEDVPNEDDFPDHEFLLYVNNTGRSNELQAALGKGGDVVSLLRHEDL